MQADDILQRPAVAIVILTWNGRKFLEQYLPSVVRLPYQPLDIYIADNASTDDTVDFVKANYPSIKIIAIPKNEGFAKGYNVALKQVVADYYFLVNQDVELTPNCLEPMIEIMESNVMIAACQPKILAAWDKSRFEHAGAAGGYIDAFGYPFCRGRLFNIEEQDTGQYTDAREIFWASGAALLIRAELFNRFKGFDPDFFAHMEEIDLCWRIRNLGYKIYYCADSAIYHVGAGTLSKMNPKKTFYNFRNNLLLLCKNHAPEYFYFKLFLRICLDGVAGLRFIVSGEFAHCIAVIKAHFSFYALFKQTLRKRNAIRGQIVRYADNGVYRGSIVWDYFVRGKSKFSDIREDLFKTKS